MTEMFSQIVWPGLKSEVGRAEGCRKNNVTRADNLKAHKKRLTYFITLWYGVHFFHDYGMIVGTRYETFYCLFDGMTWYKTLMENNHLCCWNDLLEACA